MSTIKVGPSITSDLSCSTANRQLLSDAGTFAINIVGGAGCGKTSLIKATVERLILRWRIGVITADPGTRRDAERLVGCAEQVVQVQTGPQDFLHPEHIRAALEQFDLPELDLLLIENISSLIGPAQYDLGQNAVVSLFSVAAGDDKAAKYPAIVRMADLVLLNKIDLLGVAPFNVAAFKAEVARLNPSADVIEASTLRGDGLETWFKWLGERQKAVFDPAI